MLALAVLGTSLALATPAMGQARTGAGGAAARPVPTAAITGVSETSPLTGRPIARVEVQGNVRTDAKYILDQLRVQPGQNYLPSLVNDDLRQLASTQRFLRVRAEVIAGTDERVTVRYVVEERPLVTAVEIVGNRAKKLEDIRELVSTRPNQGVDWFTINSDIEAIERFYRKDGYPSVKVSVDQALVKDKGIVKYTIAEGPRARIGSVKFEGNASVKTSLLKWKINTKSYIWIFRKGILDEDTLERDLAIIRDTYVSKGFLDAQVSHSLEYTPDKKWINVKFIVNEGPKYKVGKITLAGNKVFSEAVLMSNAPLKSGDFITRDKVEATQRRIDDRYGVEGYIYRNIDIRTAYTNQPGVVDVTITITEGEPYAAGQIIVRGNPNIQDRVVRRQLRIYPDQTIDSTAIKKSIDRLKATRLFPDVKITPIGNEPGVRNILAEVQEGQTGRFLVGAGISSNSGVLGQVSLEQNNFDITNPPRSLDEFISGQSFKGAGQYFRILLEPGTEVQRYRVTFEEPYLFDSPYSFANDAYYFTRVRESYDEQRLGDIVTLGRRWTDIWSTAVAFRAEEVGIRGVTDYNGNGISESQPIFDEHGNITGYLNDSSQTVLNEKGNHFLTSIKPSVTRDTTDSRIFPTEGTRTTFAWEQYGAMGGDVEMSKLTLRFDWFHTVYQNIFDRKTVFSLRNEVGVIPFGDSPFYERFYGGGIGNLRGFKFRGVGPRDGPPQDRHEDPIGGDFSWVTTGELNFPIWEEILRGVVFVDVGTVERDITVSTIRSDAGVGVRVQIPFLGSIPLALDFALPISKADGDKTQLISFSLGIPF